MNLVFVRNLIAASLTLLFVCLLPNEATASVRQRIGSYDVVLTTNPNVIPGSGKATLILQIRDRSGKAIEGAEVKAIARMPGMPMGEREEQARPRAGQPGIYEAPANFPMGGKYEIGLKISGPQGAAEGAIPVETGMNTAEEAGGFSLSTILLWIVVLATIGYVLFRMSRTGQRIELRRAANRQVIGGLLLIAVMLFVAFWAVRNLRRPGAMDPIEAQSMEMNAPAPSGVRVVELASVTRGTVESTVRYTGQAVAYSEVDVQPRVQGWITEMPVYQGDRVRKGQLLSRLDTSQIGPQVAERRAMVSQAEQGVEVARTEARKADEEVDQARAELGIRQGALEESRANLTAAREEKANAEADLNSMRSMVTDAESQLEAARADQEYWAQEIGRMRQLLDQGAVSKDEYQKSQAQAATADAKVRQAQAGVASAQSKVRAAQAAVRKADAMVLGAHKKINQAQAELMAHHAHVRSAKAAASSARQRISQAQSAANQARAGLQGVTTTQGYSEVRSPVDGVVTQRVISPGVLVNPGQVILRVAQIQPIRLQANVAGVDLERIKVGAIVAIRGRDEAAKPLYARLTSIAPAFDPAARTGVAEAVVPNEASRFLPGQYVSMEITLGRSEGALRIPSRAVHYRTVPTGGTISTESSPFVWVAEPAGGAGRQFTARQVPIEVRSRGGEYVEVALGLTEGQKVVVSGGQTLRDGDTVVAAGAETAVAVAESNPVQRASVSVTESGYEPASLSLKAGVPAEITFTRKTDQTCGTEVIFPDHKINTPLPLNKPTVVRLTPEAGETQFTCGMDMLRGKVVAR